MCHHPCIVLFLACVVAAAALATGANAQQITSLPQVGNGFLATFVNTSALFGAGVFNGETVVSQRAALPATGRTFPLFAAYLSEQQSVNADFELRMKEGLFSYKAQQGNLTATLVWYAHRTRRELFVQEVSLSSSSSESTNSKLGGHVQAVELVDFTVTDSGSSQAGVLTTLSSTVSSINGTDLKVNVTLYQTVAPEWPSLNETTQICRAFLVAPTWMPVDSKLYIMSTYCTTVPPRPIDGQLCGCAVSKLQSAVLDSASLREEHVTAWAELWNHNLEVEEAPGTNSTLGKVITASLYALLSSMRPDVPWSSSPGGLPTSGYNGHTFWDMETWMFPTLALLHPDIAYGSAVKYRLLRLAGAENNAQFVTNPTNHSIQAGAMAFPWESAVTGYPVCPWPQGADSEIHITADVVVAWRLYYFMSLDRTFLMQIFEALNGTSAFWLSRCQESSDGTWHLNGVTPPDEYHFGNDSVYTNAVVKMAINFTLYAAEVLNVQWVSPEYEAQLRSLGANLIILYNATEDYHPEFQGYDGLTKVKQADVILLNFPMGYPGLQSSTIANDLNYYAARTDPLGPAMTWSMFSVGYFSIGEVEKAKEYFGLGYSLNVFPPFYEWHEVAGGSGCPNFVTGAGGFLQSIWGGLLHLRITGPGQLQVGGPMAFMPDEALRVSMKRLFFCGTQLSVSMVRTGQEVQMLIERHDEGSRGAMITAGGLSLVKGQTLIFELTMPVPIACQV